MTDSVISAPLFQKEVRQNAVIFFMPFLFLIIFLVMKTGRPQFIPLSLTPALVIAIPAALALAYGVQAFDLEERGLTRDFLLVKPLTDSQIIWTKFSAGLIFLFAHSILWKILFTPQMVQWPFIPTLQGFLFLAALCLELIVYCAAFLSGALIKGPMKIILALGVGTVASLWFFLGWFACITVLMRQISLRFQLWPYLVIIIVTLLQLLLIMSIMHYITHIFLKNIPWETKIRSFIRYAVLLILLPLITVGGGCLSKPVISSADSFVMLFKGEQAWFQAIQGVKQPGKTVYAVSDALGRLGLVAKGFGPMPRLIYQNHNDNSLSAKPLTNLQWSPDGNNISFCDNGIIKIYSLQTHKVKTVYPGHVSLWSADSRRLLTGQVTGKYYFKTAKGALAGSKIHLTLHDINQSKQLGVYDLAAPNLALGWDSQLQQLIIFDQSWSIRVANLLKQTIMEINVLRPDASARKIIYAKMISSPSNKHLFLIQVYHANPIQIKQDRYDIYLYLFNATDRRVRYLAGFRGIADLIADPLDKEILIAKVRGVYRRTILTPEDQ